ncbi:MAG TPA: hypothetical protein PLE74_04790 [Candidatus Cloacimonadota bacterium]|nr:hypothetical protein [Candidatus Cloacimonadota bacterium]
MEATFEQQMAYYGFIWNAEEQRWENQLSRFKFDNRIAGVLTTTFIVKPTTDHQFDTWIQRHTTIQGLMPKSLELSIHEDDLFDYLRKRFDIRLGFFNYGPLYDKRGIHYPATDEDE